MTLQLGSGALLMLMLDGRIVYEPNGTTPTSGDVAFGYDWTDLHPGGGSTHVSATLHYDGQSTFLPPELGKGSSNDTIYGDDGNDTIFAGPGEDLVQALGGADRVLGGDGADILSGGTGADRIFGEGGADVIAGGIEAPNTVAVPVALAGNSLTLSVADVIAATGLSAAELSGSTGTLAADGTTVAVTEGLGFGQVRTIVDATVNGTSVKLTLNQPWAAPKPLAPQLVDGTDSRHITVLLADALAATGLTREALIPRLVGGLGLIVTTQGLPTDSAILQSATIQGGFLHLNLRDALGSTPGNTGGVVLNVASRVGLGGDLLDGGDGNDVIYAGEGFDTGISHERNADTPDLGTNILRGRDGNDTLYGSNGPDQLFGGNDADVLDGGASADILYGDNGPDDYFTLDDYRAVGRLSLPRISANVSDAAAGVGSFVAAGSSLSGHPDYAGWSLRFTSGKLEGEWRIVTGYDAAHRRFTFDRPFDAAPEEGAAFELDQLTVPERSRIEQIRAWSGFRQDLLNSGNDHVADDLSRSVGVNAAGYISRSGPDTIVVRDSVESPDGQGGSDQYRVTLSGGTAASKLDVYDSGGESPQATDTPAEAVARGNIDTLRVIGTDFADLFLLRANTQTDGNRSDSVAFVALINTADASQPVAATDPVERVNYRRIENLILDARAAMTGSLSTTHGPSLTSRVATATTRSRSASSTARPAAGATR